MSRPRLNKANLLITALALLLGFAVVTQVQLNRAGGLESLRQDELIRLLDQVSARSTDLDRQVRVLQAQRETIASGQGSTQDAVRRAQARLDTLGLLAGTLPASGPGIALTIRDPGGQVTPAAILDAIEELRDAGAEVIDIGGVRVVTSTAVTGVAGHVKIDGVEVPNPMVITAIGDPVTMATAMKIPGGVQANVQQQGGEVQIREDKALSVTSLHTANSPRYAQAVPDQPAQGSAPTSR